MDGEEWCLTSREADELARFTAQVYLYAITAYRACSLSDPGVEEGVRTLP